MLSDTKIKALKPKEKTYKESDRDGLYVMINPTGSKVFRYDYRFNGRRETLTIGKYGIISLAEAREILLEAKKLLNQGISPQQAKKDTKQNQQGNTIDEWWLKYFNHTELAESTRKVKAGTYVSEIKPQFERKLLTEIKAIHIRTLCETILERGAPTTATRVRDIFNAIYKYAILKGLDIHNPASTIENKGYYRGKPRSRSLTPKDIGLFLSEIDECETYPTVIIAIKLLLLTMLRKSEVVNAKWDEIDLESKVWIIPAERMKARREHNVYLSDQACELIGALKIHSHGSEFLFAARGNKRKPMNVSSVNRAASRIIERVMAKYKFESFVIHDFRRTASTILHEKGYNTDHIEKCLAHTDGSIRGVYNKAEYEAERRILMQDWANMIDAYRKQDALPNKG
ncbi:phage integrase [Vitreoscilla sp. C1]|uniref:tyrosine-type recombinase/integrase n=1 Tax=Vitreoscilla sp. (strain C1) TaxID=96942 RepID=UPI000CDBF049|nr:tyrosine-type recombinase/integrase [Vitreoscilla sp. C1]AUZ05224.1 phage integrase [Vitreoscilla sp. C1]